MILPVRFGRWLWTIALMLAVFVLPLPAFGVGVAEIPNPRQTYGGWVTDMADMLDASTETELNRKITQLERQNGSEIAIVTVPDTAPAASPKALTTELFNTWGIGKRGEDNGVLFLISKGDRRVEIETGSGLETVLPDTWVETIIRTEVIPPFKQEEYATGIMAGTDAIVEQLSDEFPGRSPFGFLDLPKFVGAIAILASVTLAGILWSRADAKAKSRSHQASYRVSPTGRSRVSAWSHQFEFPLQCDRCGQPMQAADETLCLSRLSPTERVARDIGSLVCRGWCCPNCAPDDFHLRLYERNYLPYVTCPNCQELTIKRGSETIKAATPTASGKRRIRERCAGCNYKTQREEIIPRIRQRTSTARTSTGASSSSWNSSWGGGGDSGGSFGGGGSDGGGAGGSW